MNLTNTHTEHEINLSMEEFTAKLRREVAAELLISMSTEETKTVREITQLLDSGAAKLPKNYR